MNKTWFPDKVGLKKFYWVECIIENEFNGINAVLSDGGFSNLVSFETEVLRLQVTCVAYDHGIKRNGAVLSFLPDQVPAHDTSPNPLFSAVCSAALAIAALRIDCADLS